MKKLVFFIETRKPIGGSQIQFLNFAAYISEHYNYQTYYINYPNPIVEEKYANTGIIFLDIQSCDYSILEDAVFFTPINYLFYLLTRIQSFKKTKIFLYFYHPNVFEWLNAQIYIKHRQSESLLQLLADTHSYCFMDSSNYLSMHRKTNIALKPIYLPVTLHNTYNTPLKAKNTLIGEAEREINIGWLGRLDNDKIYSVINTADNLLKLNHKIKMINFHLIGDGNAKEKISIKEYSPNIRFIFTSYLYNEERDKYITENIDIMVAMGISAIETAMLYIPTVIPIVSPKRFWTNSFVYIQDILGYSLGWNIQEIDELGKNEHTLQEIIDDIYKKGNKLKLGKLAHDFCCNEFSLKNASENLINMVEESILDVEKCLNSKQIIRQLQDYSYYKALRPNRNYSDFHEFIARINRLHAKSFFEKINYIFKELKKRVKRKLSFFRNKN